MPDHFALPEIQPEFLTDRQINDEFVRRVLRSQVRMVYFAAVAVHELKHAVDATLRVPGLPEASGEQAERLFWLEMNRGRNPWGGQ